MIQLYLSRDLAKDLASLPIEQAPTSTEVSAGAVIWYAHRVTIMRRKCIIALEYQSRYAMVFCGLTKPDFINFPQLFGQRLLQEACVITQLHQPLPEPDFQLLCELAKEVSTEQKFACRNDRSVQSHINQIKDHLEDLVLRGGYPLPETDEEAMQFGLIANDMLRKTKNHKDYFVPLKVYKEFWLGMIRHVKEQVAGPILNEGPDEELNEGSDKEPEKEPKQHDSQHQVIDVDFVKKRRR